jgi:hypothetical protein
MFTRGCASIGCATLSTTLHTDDKMAAMLALCTSLAGMTFPPRCRTIGEDAVTVSSTSSLSNSHVHMLSEQPGVSRLFDHCEMGAL